MHWQLVVIASLVIVACSNGDDDRDAPPRIVPENLSVRALEGGNGVLELRALTLQREPSGPVLYAALTNVGDAPACHAALSVELYDRDEQSVAAGISGLLTQRFYRLTDGSESIAACVGPGDVTMAAVTDWPSDLAIEDVGFAVYRCPYFALDVEPIDGLAIRDVKRVTRGAETAYAGTFENGFDVAVRDPSVTVFPVDRGGRPLGIATTVGADEIAPGERWRFETSRVDVTATDYVAFPAAALDPPR